MKRKLFFVCLMLASTFGQSARATDYQDRLEAGTWLWPGDTIQSKYWFLTMQADGNLVFYRKAGMVALWSSGTHGAFAQLQTDGNLVVDDSTGHNLWGTGTGGTLQAAYDMGIYSDGTLKIFRWTTAGGTNIWSSTPDPVKPTVEGCPGGSSPQRYPVCIGGMTFNLPMCSQADAAVYAHSQGGYYGACH